MKLVRFSDGTFGVRKGNWFTGYKFLDLKHPKYWWTKDSEHIADCSGDQLRAAKLYTMLTDKGTPI